VFKSTAPKLDSALLTGQDLAAAISLFEWQPVVLDQLCTYAKLLMLRPAA
jgi:hypothetical protein